MDFDVFTAIVFIVLMLSEWDLRLIFEIHFGLFLKIILFRDHTQMQFRYVAYLKLEIKTDESPSYL